MDYQKMWYQLKKILVDEEYEEAVKIMTKIECEEYKDEMYKARRKQQIDTIFMDIINRDKANG